MSSFLLKIPSQKELVERLNKLLSYLVSNFDYYQKSFSGLDLNINSLEDVANFPFLDKKEKEVWNLVQEVLAKNPPAYFETSGTSGLPFPVIPDLGKQRMQEFAEFIAEWLELKKLSQLIKRAVIALPFEMNPIGFKYFFALQQLGIMSIPVGVRTHLCSTRKVIEIFDRLKPELLVARPMETLRYAEAMLELGKEPQKSSIRKIILTGEIISEAKFKRISRLFGNADVYSVYGLTEVDSGGMVSCKNYQYHLPSKPYLLVEILGDDFKTRISENDGVGNIVLTNTNINFMPLFRYKTGDYAVLQTKCNCNQFDTPVVNLLGRREDKILFNRKNIFPVHIENFLFQNDCISSDYQIVMHDGNLSLRVEWLGNYDENAVSKFIKSFKMRIQTELDLNIDIKIFKPTSLFNKFGIPKSKAGTLYVFNEVTCNKEMDHNLMLNYSCSNDL